MRCVALCIYVADARPMNEARRAEPILWMLLSNVYRLLKKKDGISTRDIASIIEDNKKVALRES